MTPPKPELLYLTPVIPSVTGNGLAMRAGMVLEALAAGYSVSLLVIKLYASHEADVPERFVRMCRRSAVATSTVGSRTLWTRIRTRRKRDTLDEILRCYQAFFFDRIHVFRLAMLPFARRFFHSSPDSDRHLDLDEVESSTHMRIARLCRLNGDVELASAEEAAVDSCSLLERQACTVFDRIYVCSGKEKEELSKLCAPSGIEILPNGVRVQPLLPAPPAELPFCFLFAGTLGYYPNEDAVLYLCREIVPRLRQRTIRNFEIRIVGSGATARIYEAVRKAGLTLLGPVPDIQPSYQRASAVIVPLRAGGGTRIKILEAWSYRRPVVTTTIGIEGIPASDGEHALMADTPDGFSECCVRLMEIPELASRLAANAYALLSHDFSPDAIERAIAGQADQSR